MKSSLESALVKSKSVGYVPMRDEPDFTAFLTVRGLPPPDYVIPASKELDPEAVQHELQDRYGAGAIALFVPGREFDRSGTRHGRGRGWYDRLLSKLPAEWLRIGVLNDSLLSEAPLTRKEWDEPVDFLLIQRGNDFEVIQTNARAGVLQSKKAP